MGKGKRVNKKTRMPRLKPEAGDVLKLDYGGQEEKKWRERKNLFVKKRELAEDSLHDELSYTAELLLEDAKNKYAWSHRQWALEALGKGYADELGFCNTILESNHNVYNRLVWDQRCFAVKKCLELGLMIIRSCEVTFATRHILRNPENENPWRYLKFLCNGEMDALAKNDHLQWALRCVFVEARERFHAVTDDIKKGTVVCVMDSVNKRGCLFALDLVSDLLKHGYQPLEEVVDAIKDIFKEFVRSTLVKTVDFVLALHGNKVMELSGVETRKIQNLPGAMEVANGKITSLSDHLNNPSYFFWSENRWVRRKFPPPSLNSRIIVQCSYSSRSYSQLCGVAGFSETPVLFFPENPRWIEFLEEAKIDRIKRPDTGQVMDMDDDEGSGFPPDIDGKYKNLPERLRKFCWQITNFGDFDFDNYTKALVLREGHNNPAAWQARRLVNQKLDLGTEKEVEILELLSERSSDNYLYWHQRRWVSEKIGKTAVAKELEFTKNVLSKDAYNYHAWSHRRWVLKVLGGEGWFAELKYCDLFLAKDSSNCFAWDQIYFVVSQVRLEMQKEMVEYVIHAIEKEPENELLWLFLQSQTDLKEEFLRRKVRVIAELGASCAKAQSQSFSKSDAIEKKRFVNALKMALFCEDKYMCLSFWKGREQGYSTILKTLTKTLKSIDVTWI